MIDPPNALRATPKADAMGGGGGQRGLTPVSRGALPKLEPEPLAAPKIPPLQTPMLAIESSVDMQKDLKSAALPDLGVPNSPLVNLSMGDGRGGGMGPGNGNGVGPGSDGNTGGGVRRVGGGVSALRFSISRNRSFQRRRVRRSSREMWRCICGWMSVEIRRMCGLCAGLDGA